MLCCFVIFYCIKATVSGKCLFISFHFIQFITVLLLEILKNQKKEVEEEPIFNKKVLQALNNHAQQMAKIALESNGSGMDLVKDIKVLCLCFYFDQSRIIDSVNIKNIITLWKNCVRKLENVKELKLNKFYSENIFKKDEKYIKVNLIIN